jgi:hypothetical protein
LTRFIKSNFLVPNLAFLINMGVFWNRFSTSIYPGDLGDSRVVLFWMEHWFQSIQGMATFRNLPVFFPITNTLSGSDAFLVQGLLHSVLRFLSFDIGTSFVVATMLVHAIGSYSCVALLQNFNIHLNYKVLVIVLYGSMTPFWLSRNHVQLLIFPMLGWIVYFLYKFYVSRNSLYFTFSILMFFLILLSAGYAIAFSLFYVIIFFAISIFFESPRRVLSNLLIQIKFRATIWALIISSPLIYLFKRLYLSSDSLVSSHTKAATLFYSPSASDLASTPSSLQGLEGSIPIFSKLLENFNSLPNPTGEYGGSFGFITILFILGTCLFLFRRFIAVDWNAKSFELGIVFLITITLAFCYLIILKDGRGVSIWASTFYHLPFFDGIRVISRFSLFAALLIPFILGLGLWEIRRSIKRHKLFDRLVIIFSVLIFLNQPANYYGSFHSSEILVLNQIDSKLKNSCLSFYLLKSSSSEEDFPSWVTSGDALALATRTGIPAINGASSFFPEEYPMELYTQSDRLDTLSKLHDWIKLHDLSRVCLIEYSRAGYAPVRTIVTGFEYIKN